MYKYIDIYVYTLEVLRRTGASRSSAGLRPAGMA